VTRCPDRRPLREWPAHWPTMILVTGYVLALLLGMRALYLWITSIAGAIATVAK